MTVSESQTAIMDMMSRGVTTSCATESKCPPCLDCNSAAAGWRWSATEHAHESCKQQQPTQRQHTQQIPEHIGQICTKHSNIVTPILVWPKSVLARPNSAMTCYCMEFDFLFWERGGSNATCTIPLFTRVCGTMFKASPCVNS